MSDSNTLQGPSLAEIGAARRQVQQAQAKMRRRGALPGARVFVAGFHSIPWGGDTIPQTATHCT